MRSLVFAAPAPLDLATGGYIYDRRIVAGLRRLGWTVTVEPLASSFPAPSEADLEATGRWLEGQDASTPIVIDGLAFGAMGHVAPSFRDRRCLIALVHHPLADETGLDRATAERLRDGEMLALAAARGVVVTSPFTAHRLDAYGVAPQRVHVVEPGVDRRPISRGSDGVPKLLCVASYVPRKGHDVLLDALERLRDRHWRLICVGTTGLHPDYEARVRERAASFGGRIELHGNVPLRHLDALYASADLFVLASHYEGYGMVFAEAIASGLPIVATAGGATAQTVPPAAARLVGPGDVTGLARELAEMLDAPAARRSLARAARDARAGQQDWATAARRFAAVVDAIVA